MNTVDQFLWVDFYQEFAQKLVAYRDNRLDLIKKVKEIYKLSAISMPTLEKDNNLVDIIDNGGYEIDFIKNKEISFYESVKLLNKKYKIGLVNSFTVVNEFRQN